MPAFMLLAANQLRVAPMLMLSADVFQPAQRQQPKLTMPCASKSSAVLLDRATNALSNGVVGHPYMQVSVNSACSLSLAPCHNGLTDNGDSACLILIGDLPRL
jgi:hypothetical protein